MTCRVRILRRAREDLFRMTHWLAERSAEGAERWLNALERALDSVANAPESHSLTEENDAFPHHTIRQFFFRTRRGRTYRGLFTMVGTEVRLLCLRGPGQDLVSPKEVELPPPE